MINLNEDKNIYIGIMSGTSVDGIDVAAVEINGDVKHPNCKLLAFKNTPYGNDDRARIFELFDTENATVDKLGEMNFLLGRLYGEAANSLIDEFGIDRGRIAAIGSHGQTVYHAPDGNVPCTVQIGEGSVISRLTGCICVSDFRVADVAAGGNGAPLVPFTEYALFAKDDLGLILQNIGGISNSTILPAACSADEVFAFDNGPGNMLIDAVTKALFGKEMDFGGKLASQGKVNYQLLDTLMDEPYYKKSPPKTTGRELFGADYAKKIIKLAGNMDSYDLLATVTMLTARVIANSYRDFVKNKAAVSELIVGGGGSYNKTLMAFLSDEMEKHGVKVYTQEEKGENSDAKEAVAFALLAYYTLKGLPNNLQSATGAKYPAVMGKISF